MAEIAIQKESHWFRNIMIIIIIGLLVWQYVLPVFIEIKTPLDYFDEYYDTYLNADSSGATWYPFILDEITNNRTEFKDPTFYYMSHYNLTYAHTYQIGIVSDIPGKISGEYSWNIDVKTWNITSSAWDHNYISIKIPAYSCYLKHSWTIPQDTYFVNYERSDVVTMQLYNTDGNLLLNKIDSYSTQGIYIWNDLTP
jgi:hypothetical protein